MICFSWRKPVPVELGESTSERKLVTGPEFARVSVSGLAVVLEPKITVLLRMTPVGVVEARLLVEDGSMDKVNVVLLLSVVVDVAEVIFPEPDQEPVPVTGTVGCVHVILLEEACPVDVDGAVKFVGIWLAPVPTPAVADQVKFAELVDVPLGWKEVVFMEL